MHISDEDEEALAPREVDGLLTEMVGMSGRWSLFRKFMSDRLKVCLLLPEVVYP